MKFRHKESDFQNDEEFWKIFATPEMHQIKRMLEEKISQKLPFEEMMPD
jgi:hypothetical protein